MKRLFDVIASLSGLLVFSPFLLVIFLLVRIKLGSPVLFVQKRPGKDEKIFKLYKFRTMTNEVDQHGNLLPNEKRITSFGNFLRNTSLDELPELINIVKGDMSIVGPRPLLVDYLPLYNDFQKKRHKVKPGITGWAQINGRNAISWEEKFLYDVWYVENRNLLLDFSIIFKTIAKVIKREGISHEGDVAMPRFTGNS